MITLPDIFNVASHFVDRNVARGIGAKIAIECGDERVTYSQLLERTNRTGNAFRQLGIRPENRVLLLLLDSPEFLYCFFGAIKIGAVAVPASTLAKSHEYEYILNDSRARVVVLSETILPQIESIPKDKLCYLRYIVVVGNKNGAHANLRDLMEASSPELDVEPTSKNDAAFWLYSSGSTGPPKACVHLHHDMVVCSELFAKGVLQISEADRCYSVARLFFAYGLGNAGYFPLHVGATTILSPARPTSATIYADIQRYRPTLFFSVPTNYAAILSHRSADGREFDLSSIRLAISAGEALPVALFERFRERFGIEILDGLGSTETLQTVISNRPGDVRPGSSGKIVSGYEAKIVGDDENSAEPDQIGDLWIKGDSVCSGYWNQHEKTKDTFAGDWFRTGDKYSRDQDGYFWHAGRTDDLFKVAGRWLRPSEVENALIAHDAVKEAAVVARKDESGLLKPFAFVVLNSETASRDKLAGELQEWVAHKIGGYKSPRWIDFVPEIPKTATGKIQRFKLRALCDSLSEENRR